MRCVAVGAIGNVFLQLRIVRHVTMGASLLAAGRNVVGGRSNEFVKRAMAVEALVFGFFRSRAAMPWPKRPEIPAAGAGAL